MLNRILKIIMVFVFLSIAIGCKDNHKDNLNSEVTIKDYDKKMVKKYISKATNSLNNDDSYATSTYRPGNPLYKPVLYIQRKRWDLAKPLLEDLVNKNNPDAMYWLANISGGNAFSGQKIAKLFERSAKLGNPYAALRLSPSSPDCSSYLSSYCDKKWEKLGLKLLSDRAEKGDVKAQFYLLDINDKYDSKKYIKSVLDNAKNNNFYPLYKYLSYFNEISIEDRKMLYKIMSSKKYYFVANLMRLDYLNGYIDMGDKYYSDSFRKLSRYGDLSTVTSSFYYEYLKKKPSRNGLKNYIEGYFYSSLIKNVPDFKESSINKSYIEYDYVNFVKYKNEKYFKSSNIKDFSREEVEIMKDEVVHKLKNVKPNIYIDEYNYEP